MIELATFTFEDMGITFSVYELYLTVPWINTRFRDSGFMENSNGTLGHGDFYEYRMVVTKVSGFMNSSFKALRKSFTRKFRRQFNSWSVNQMRSVTKQRLPCRRWRLYFVCYNDSNLYSVIIIGSYDFWVSNKCIHLIQNPLLVFTPIRNMRQYIFLCCVSPCQDATMFHWGVHKYMLLVYYPEINKTHKHTQ
jgi:hypothetical protein